MSSMESTSRLVLGTAQLGLEYGIANRTGKPNVVTAAAIVQEAWNYGIRRFDTARGYGDSEVLLGKCLARMGVADQAQIITKMHPAVDPLDRQAVSLALEQSLARMQVPRVAGFMLHREEQLDYWPRGLGETLRGFVWEGRAGTIGASVYSPARALMALETEGIGMIQIPANLLDRRFLKAGVFETARRHGKQVYLRSIFLQGLLLLSTTELPEKMAYARLVLERLARLATDTGLSIQEMALIYLRDRYQEAHIIFGAETPGQVRENCSLWIKGAPVNLLHQVEEAFPAVEERILNPTLWPR